MRGNRLTDKEKKDRALKELSVRTYLGQKNNREALGLIRLVLEDLVKNSGSELSKERMEMLKIVLRREKKNEKHVPRTSKKLR